MSCSYAAPFCDTVRLFGSRLSPKVTIPADFHIKDRQGQQYTITNRMLYAILSSCHACSSNAFSSPIKPTGGADRSSSTHIQFMHRALYSSGDLNFFYSTLNA